MPNEHTSLTALFADIADAIRAKTGDAAGIRADAFPEAIAAIPTGEDKAFFRLGSSNVVVKQPFTEAVAPMQVGNFDFLIPCSSAGNDVKLNLTQPFEIGCRFQMSGIDAAPDSRQIFGSLDAYYQCPTISVGTNGFYYNVSTSGSGWNYRGVKFTPDGYVTPTNTTISVRLTWDGTDFAFRVDDGTDVYTAALSGVTPFYSATYRFEFGGENRSAMYSVSSNGASILLEGTYLQQGDTVIWGKKIN